MFRHPTAGLLIALASCTVSLAEDKPLAIATFNVDVTPPIGAPLCNGGIQPAKEIVDPLSARGLILFVEPSPIVLCAVDWVGIGNTAHDAWREALAEAAGTTPARVTVNTVHQHDAPGCDFSVEEVLEKHGLSGAMFDPVFARKAIARVADAVRKAVENPQPVTHFGTGQAKVEKVASNRRVLGPDGKVKYVRYSSCRIKEAIAAPEGVIDPTIRVLSFWNADRPLVCLSYYATHPQSYYGQGGVSADFVGIARTQREAALPGVVHIHFNGAGGNIAAGKYNDGSPGRRPVLAGRLAAGMKAAWDATTRTPIRPADIEWRVRPVTLPVRDFCVEETLLKKLRNPKNKLRDRVRAARDLVWTRRMKGGHKIDLTCLRIGPVYVLHMPGELFVEYQLAAQKMRPQNMVCMAAYADYGPGYIGTTIAYSQGGYETGPVSRVAPEVEPVLMNAMRQLLK